MRNDIHPEVKRTAERRSPFDRRARVAPAPGPYEPERTALAEPRLVVRYVPRRGMPVQLISTLAAALLIAGALFELVFEPTAVLMLLVPADSIMPPDWPVFSGTVRVLAAAVALLLGLLLAIAVWALYPACRGTLAGMVWGAVIAVLLFIAAVFSHLPI